MTAYPCRKCGREVAFKKWRKGSRICTECGLSNAITYNLSMAQKKGDGYSAWLERMRATINAAEPSEEELNNGSERHP